MSKSKYEPNWQERAAIDPLPAVADVFLRDTGATAMPSSNPPDLVNHPPHYTSHPSGIECIDIVRHFNFNVGNAVKYLWRAGLKSSNSKLEDLRKAAWYVADEIARSEKDETSK